MTRIIIILILHTIGDFFLQGSKLSRLKAIKLPYLFEHVGIYTLLFVAFSPLLLGFTFVQGLAFSFVNGALHFIIDFFTGKFKTKYHDTDESKYIAAVGVDHTLHLVILIISYIYLFPDAINTNYFSYFN